MITKTDTDTAATTDSVTQPEFVIQRVYVKDLSFEAPSAPAIFKQQWHPELDLHLQTNVTELEEGVFEIVLGVTVTVKSEGKTAFLVEVKQAGIFTLKLFPAGQIRQMLGVVCPTVLFPFAREVVSDVVTRGGFPQLVLSPVNFEALYAKHVEQQKTQKREDSGTSDTTVQ